MDPTNDAPKLDRYRDGRGNLFSTTAEEAKQRGYTLASAPAGAEPEAEPAPETQPDAEPEAKARPAAANKARSTAENK